MKRLRKRQHKQENRRLISDYYSAGSYFGMSASEMFYILATQLARTDINILWLAIVGLTDQYLNGRIGHEKYLIQAQGYREEVLKFSTSVINKNNSTLGNGDSENTLPLEDSLNTDDIFTLINENSGIHLIDLKAEKSITFKASKKYLGFTPISKFFPSVSKYISSLASPL